MKKHIYLYSITISIIAIIIFTFLLIYNSVIGVKLNIEKGKVDFANISLDNNLYLNGEWEVYQHILLGSNNLNPSDYTYEYETIPSNQNTKKQNISYRIVITNFPKNLPTIINFSNQVEDYSIYFNRTLVKASTSNYKHPISYTLESSNELEIIIEINNNSLSYANMINTPQICSYQHYQQTIFITLIYYFTLIGFLLYSIIYIIYIHSFQDFRREAIYFGLMILFACLNIFFSPKISSLLNLPTILSFYIYYFSLFLITVFIYLFIRKFISMNRLTIFDIIFYTIAIILFLLTIILPLSLLSLYIAFIKTLNIILLIIIFLYAIIYTKKSKYHSFIYFIIFLLIIGNTLILLQDKNIIFYHPNIMAIIYFSISLIYTAIITLSHTEKIASAEEFIKLNNKIRDTEFTFLNSQIQSHFIYNSLNSIQSLCLIEPLKAADLIEDFSSYLRSRLEFNKMPILIEFADELNNIKTYINIEKERFGERIKYQYNIQIGEFKIPPLSVQPLVENAIKHGLSKKPKGGTLTISTYQDQNYIYIKIEDDGIGFDPNKLSDKQRIGTTNIRNRLSLHLDATLEINSKENVGTTSIIKIPIKKALR